MRLPTLVVVSGPAGSGKTTLAHELARAVPCPAVCRDEIKEGMVHAAERFDPTPGDDLTQRTLRVFFAVIRLLLERRVSLVAEAAFQDKLWRPKLEPLMQLARLRIVQCHTDAATAWTRHDERRSRKAHVDVRLLSAIEFESYFEAFHRVTIDAPSIEVDTTSGYHPEIDDIVAFVNSS